MKNSAKEPPIDYNAFSFRYAVTMWADFRDDKIERIKGCRDELGMDLSSVIPALLERGELANVYRLALACPDLVSDQQRRLEMPAWKAAFDADCRVIEVAALEAKARADAMVARFVERRDALKAARERQAYLQSMSDGFTDGTESLAGGGPVAPRPNNGMLVDTD
jgi:hypothetical protein